MVRRGGRGLVSGAVREALLTVASPHICERMIRRSLAAQGISEVPESGPDIGDWLDGALRGEVESTVGADAADVLMMQLGPIAAYAAISGSQASHADRHTGVRNTVRTIPALDERKTDLWFDPGVAPVWSPQTLRAPQPVHMHRTVLVASKRPSSFAALRGSLGSSADVVDVRNLAGLLLALEHPDMHEPIVVIDCHSPSVQVSSVSAICEDFPHGTTVVLWGVDVGTWAELEQGAPEVCAWVRCASEATSGDVSYLCSTLLR